MDSPSSSVKSSGKSRMERFIRRVISPAIVGKACPICLRNLDARRAAVLTVCSHAYCLECINKWSNLKRKCPLCNSTFDSWFYKIDISSSRFLTQQLPALSECKSVIRRQQSTLADRRRIIQRTREELNRVNCRTRPLPRRRSFGRPGTVPPHVLAERKLQWRASVYNRRLQAVPITHGNTSQQNIARNEKERIEPWIRRELEAILDDPDPLIILHVVSSLFFSRHQGNYADGSSGHRGVEDDFLAPLKAFLHDQSNMFWHELRCFAESSLTIETYDAVVKYRRLQ